MSNKFSMDDYIDVSERIAHFSEKYPEGSLQSSWSQTTVNDRTFIVCEAFAYRTPDDERPGHGIAWEPFPGPTPYTKDSELMNAQTSAWGRAIVALGLAANRKIASRQEVKARQAAKPSEPSASTEQRVALQQKADELFLTPTDLADAICLAAGTKTRQFETLDEAVRWCERQLDRLPARLVAGVEEHLVKMAGAKPEGYAAQPVTETLS